MITKHSHFKGDIHIPNVEDTAPNSNLLGNATSLDLFIDECESDVLTQCLGYSLYDEFINQFNESGELKEEAPEKWNDLLNGKEYQVDGKNVKFRGLTFKQGNLDRSLIAYYVFYQFLENDESSYTGTGIKKEKSKNSENASAAPKAIKAWRKFYKLTVGDFDNPKIIEKSNGTGIDWLGGNSGVKSLYQFIQDMNNIDPSTYPNWSPYPFENINTLGI